MGLPNGQHQDKLGILLYPERQIDNPAKRLFEISEKDNVFIQHLLKVNNVTLENCQQYLESNKIIPGYMQTSYAAIVFILSQIEKHLMLDPNLEKPIDFIKT